MAISLLLALLSPGALLSPLAREPSRPSLGPVVRRAVVHLTESTDPIPEIAASVSWPEPAKSPAEFQAEQAAAKEAAEAASMANPRPFVLDDGGFSPVAVLTVVTFVVAGSLFFQGISGGGISRFDSDQSPEVQACIKKATTRDEASACLPPVPL